VGRGKATRRDSAINRKCTAQHRHRSTFLLPLLLPLLCHCWGRTTYLRFLRSCTMKSSKPLLAEYTVAAPLHPTACSAVSASASPRLHPHFAVPGLNSRKYLFLYHSTAQSSLQYIRFHIVPFSLISVVQSTRSSIKPVVPSCLPSDFVPLVCAKTELLIL
jgi:hypothetical protein